MTSGAQIRIGATYSDELLGEMVAVHTRRWNLKGQPGNFADTRRAEFIRGLLRDSAIPAQVSTLVCDDVLLAYRISFLWNSTLAAWNSGMNPDYAQHSPGNVLLAAEMQNALVAGLDTYDLLRGDEAYKSRWANETDSVCTYRVLKR